MGGFSLPYVMPSSHCKTFKVVRLLYCSHYTTRCLVIESSTRPFTITIYDLFSQGATSTLVCVANTTQTVNILFVIGDPSPRFPLNLCLTGYSLPTGSQQVQIFGLLGYLGASLNSKHIELEHWFASAEPKSDWVWSGTFVRELKKLLESGKSGLKLCSMKQALGSWQQKVKVC